MKQEKKSMDRRTFIKATTLGGASLALSAGVADKVRAGVDETGTASQKIPTRVLGKTGVSVPILAMGGADWTTNQSLLRVAFQMGVTFWDAASGYENGKCEEGIGQYFEKYPDDRKKVFLVTKASRTVEPKEMSRLLEQSLDRMKTDYIDLFSMHGIEEPAVLTPDVKAWADQKKKEGKIKFFGFTSHANVAQLLMAAAKHDWIDAVNTSYNYQMMKETDVQKGMDAIAKAGIGFIAMKTQAARFAGPRPNMPQGEGEGPPGQGGPPQGREGGPEGAPQGPPPGMQAQAADSEPEDLSAMSHFIDKGYTLEQAKLKLMWEDERVTTCLSKLSNLTILKDNVAAASDSRKLSSLDIKVLKQLADKSSHSYCRGCKQCDSVMASESRIHDVLRYMMYYNSYGERDEARALYRRLPEKVRRVVAVRDYSGAERACPHGIQIGNAMKDAAKLLA